MGSPAHRWLEQWPIPNPITRVNARNTFAIRGRLVRGLGPPPRGDPSASPPAGSGVLAARTRARPRTVFDHVRYSTTYGLGHVPGRLVDVRVRRNGRPRPVVRVLACLLFPLNHIQRRRVARDTMTIVRRGRLHLSDGSCESIRGPHNGDKRACARRILSRPPL